MAETPKPMLPEAPASATFKYIHPSGGEVMFTIRDMEVGKLIQKVDFVIGKLVDGGSQIVPPQQRGGGGNRPARIPVPSDGTEPLCPVHQSPMRPSRTPGEFYCTKKSADGQYCKQKAGR
jgi:hypothetical protein